MKSSSLRHKHVQLDQHKLNRALRVLGVKTETEALDRALSVVVSEDKIDTALRKARGKGRIRKVFR
jgi:Arc/MetJ family transcription regulator